MRQFNVSLFLNSLIVVMFLTRSSDVKTNFLVVKILHNRLKAANAFSTLNLVDGQRFLGVD